MSLSAKCVHLYFGKQRRQAWWGNFRNPFHHINLLQSIEHLAGLFSVSLFLQLMQHFSSCNSTRTFMKLSSVVTQLLLFIPTSLPNMLSSLDSEVPDDLGTQVLYFLTVVLQGQFSGRQSVIKHEIRSSIRST